MSCNRCAATSETIAVIAGAGGIEAKWAENRAHPQNCKECGAFLRPDGGCSRCENQEGKTVDRREKRGMDTPSLAMAAPSDAPKMRLSCGHDSNTTVSPGGEEWCTECDDFATVDAPAPDSTTASASALFEPQSDWSVRRMQLWSLMEEKAKSLGITSVKNDWTGYARSEGKGDGKVYGGFYGQGKRGQWYSVVAYGPINRSTIKDVKDFPTEADARNHYSTIARKKLSDKYRTDWPCDGKGH